MSDLVLPVTVDVLQPDGKTAQMRVGTAVRTSHGFSLRLDALSIEVREREANEQPHTSTVADLEFYAALARKRLSDPSRAKWHSGERELLTRIEAELARQREHAGR
jgi:hypothetical protein